MQNNEGKAVTCVGLKEGGGRVYEENKLKKLER